MVMVFTGHAHSFETQMTSAGDGIDPRTMSFKNSVPSDAYADPCSPFLGSASFAGYDYGDDATMDRTRRNAGTAAAVGVMVGLRFALQPVRYKTAAQKRRNAGLQFDVWSTEDRHLSNRSALAVAAYRQCQKERALQALRAR